MTVFTVGVSEKTTFLELAAALEAGKDVMVEVKTQILTVQHVGVPNSLKRESGGTPCRHWLFEIITEKGPKTFYLRVRD